MISYIIIIAIYYFTVLTFIVCSVIATWGKLACIMTALIEYLTVLLEYLDLFAI